MPKAKEAEEKKTIVNIPEDDDKEVDPELIPGTLDDEELDEEGGVLDDEEVNPFGDKWEE